MRGSNVATFSLNSTASPKRSPKRSPKSTALKKMQTIEINVQETTGSSRVTLKNVQEKFKGFVIKYFLEGEIKPQQCTSWHKQVYK